MRLARRQRGLPSQHYVSPGWYYGSWIAGGVLALVLFAPRLGFVGYVFVPLFVAVAVFLQRKPRARAVALHEAQLQARKDTAAREELRHDPYANAGDPNRRSYNRVVTDKDWGEQRPKRSPWSRRRG